VRSILSPGRMFGYGRVAALLGDSTMNGVRSLCCHRKASLPFRMARSKYVLINRLKIGVCATAKPWNEGVMFFWSPAPEKAGSTVQFRP